MHKKDVPDAGQRALSVGEKLYQAGNGFNVYSVSGLSFGKPSITVLHDADTGSGSGLSRVTPSDVCVNFPATVPLHSKALRTTGLSKYRTNKLTTPKSSMWSMMRPISIRTGVC